jgi:hypothetical protein
MVLHCISREREGQTTFFKDTKSTSYDIVSYDTVFLMHTCHSFFCFQMHCECPWPEQLSLVNMPFATRSTAAAGSTLAATASTIVTPTIDEFEQASFYAACGGGGDDDGVFWQPQVSSFHQDKFRDAEQQQWRCLSGLESMIDAALPCPSFYSPAVDENLKMCVDQDQGRGHHVSSLASSALFAAARPPTEVSDPQELDRVEFTHNARDVMQAAGILCHFKNDGIIDCSAQGAADVVEIAAKMLAYENQEEAINDAIVDDRLSGNLAVPDSLVHPDRLAIDDDADEVNKLHQYVRKELLEIFVVPQQAASSDCDDDDDDDDDEEEDDEDDGSCVKDTPMSALNESMTTRHLVTRRRSIAASSSPPSTTARRYYPGRVGLRCAHCAHVRRKSTSKAAFYPLRLKNIYREVCAWQRIHFKKCPHVPDGVRERYDHYKRIDTSRGKVKYWESAARKIGLENNPDRYVVIYVHHFRQSNRFATHCCFWMFSPLKCRDDGIVFVQTAWKA